MDLQSDDKRLFFPHDVAGADATDGVPFLQAAARRLVEIGGSEGQTSLDLNRYVCVLPGRRAIRTLSAYLTREAHAAIDAKRFNPDWVPPVFLTVGETPEKLYPQRLPEANKLTRLYCERRALQRFLTDREYLDDAVNLFPPRDGEDPAATLRRYNANQQSAVKLAQSFLALEQELADEGKSCADVVAECLRDGARRNLKVEARRWQAIERLGTLYREELGICGHVDRNDARADAVRNRTIGTAPFNFTDGEPRRYFIIGAVDLKRQQKEIFDALGDAVQYWVYAPTLAADAPARTGFDDYYQEHFRDFFDEYGCVRPERWNPDERPDGPAFALPIPDENVFQVESPQEQGEAVALLTRELSRIPGETEHIYEPIKAEQLTVGAPDPEVVPFVEEQLNALGYSTIHGEGTPAVLNRVYRTLELFAEYIETRSYDTLGELLRRPDVERWLRREWATTAEPPKSEEEDAAEREELERDAARLDDEDERYNEELESLGGLEPDNPEAEAVRGETLFSEAWLAEFDEYRANFLPTRVDRYWFVSVDEDNPKRNRFYVRLRKAAHIVDSALADFFDAPGSYMYNTLARRSGVDAEAAPLSALKIGSKEIDFAKFSLVGNVEYATRQTKKPMREWADVVSKLVRRVYDGDPIRDRDTRAQINGLLQMLNTGLDELHDVPGDFDDDLVAGAFAIHTLLGMARGKGVPPAPGKEVVEIQGWLDLLFDDAPYCVLTGFNEHVVPASRSSDLFLPNEMRRSLGLSDSSRAFARDAYLAYALACSRDAFFVVFERRTLKHDPRLPSRFVFMTAERRVPELVVRYFDGNGSDRFGRLRARHKGLPFPLQSERDEITGGGFRAPELRLEAPDPLAGGAVFPRSMNVTDFEGFLKSPYRFFLRKYERLQPIADDANELGAANFGTLMHDVLRDFGDRSKNDSKIVDSTDEHIIFNWLSSRLDERAKKKFNDYTSPFVHVQIEEIRSRLRSFADWQAKWRRSGRAIWNVEQSATIRLRDLGVKALDHRYDDTEIFGRIDRIDYCAREERWYVFDYKTFDKANKSTLPKNLPADVNEEVVVDEKTDEELFTARPGNELDKKHREALKDEPIPDFFTTRFGVPGLDSLDGKRWINLQLPLYRRFLRRIVQEKKAAGELELSKNPQIEDGKISLGYLVLTSGGVVALGAPWSPRDLVYADATCQWVVESIRRLFEEGVVNPKKKVDDFLAILDEKASKFDDFAPITLSYLADV